MADGFLRANARWLGTGLLLTFTSSFGQTYFISIFGDRIMADYGLTDGDWGEIYMIATLSSAAALVWAGRLADRIRVGRLAAMILGLFAVIAVGMSFNENVYVLIALIFGLRFCGQGMISNLGITAMGRWFRAHRGRAIAIAGLGYSVGEATLPWLAAQAELLIGWRSVWLVVAFAMVAGLAPLIAWMAKDERSPQSLTDAELSPGRDGSHWTQTRVIRNWLIWALIPGIIAHSFIGTVIFFQVGHIAETMGWTKLAMTSAYPFFAVVTIVVALVAGGLVDRFGPDRLLPFYLLPLGVGVACVGPFEGIWSWWLGLALTGMSSGITHAMWGALWAEIYGTRNLGSIKATASGFMVVGSAIGPGITGWVIDSGVAFSGQTIWMLVAVLMISAAHLVIVARLPVRPPATA